MSTTVSTEHEHPAEGMVAHQDHPSEKQYWKIFFVLFGITAVEVLLYYKSIPGVNLNNAALGILAVSKFVIVAAYFMHLKFDNKIVRRLFIGGIVLALIVFVIYLLTMGVFIDPPGARQGSFNRA